MVDVNGVFMDLHRWQDELYCVEVLNWGLDNFQYVVRRISYDGKRVKLKNFMECGEGRYCRLESFYPGGLYVRVGEVAPDPKEKFLLVNWKGEKSEAEGRYFYLNHRYYLKLTFDGEKYHLFLWNGESFTEVYSTENYICDFAAAEGDLYFAEYEDVDTRDSKIKRIDIGGM